MRVPSRTCRPPTTRTSAVPESVIALTATENSDSCQVRRSRARMVPSPASRNRPSSCGSRAKLLTTLMDERISNMRSTSDDSSALTRSARSTIRRE